MFDNVKWQENGKQKAKEMSTGIPIAGNNKRRAQKRCEELREEYEERYEKCEISQSGDILFSDYMIQWLDTQRHFIKPSTYYGYKNTGLIFIIYLIQYKYYSLLNKFNTCWGRYIIRI